MSSHLVINWLRQILTPYAHRDQVFIQVESALQAHSSLSPKTESYTFDDGRAALLLCISGTIPVTYRAARYNIPIAIWIPHDFPLQPPIVYVTPTSEMVVRKSAHIEPSGQCHATYLKTWTSKPEACSLSQLLIHLQDLFSREPPLYAKPKPSQSPISNSSSALVPSPSTSSARPPPPPPPPIPPPLRPSQPSQPSTTSFPEMPQPDLPNRPPPRPPPLYTQTTSSTPSQAQQFPHPLPRSLQVTHVQRSTSLHSPHPPHNLMPRSITHIGTRNARSDDEASSPSRPNSFVTSPPIEQHLSQITLNSQTPPPNLLDDLDQGTEPNSPQSSSKPTAHPPPRPPNPALLALRNSVHSKFQNELSNLNSSLTFEHGQLMVLQHDLLKGEPAILDEIARLEAVKEVCVGVGYRYESLVSDLKQRVQELRERKLVPVDELVCSNTVLYNQLLELVAEDQAIDDTIYHLFRALNNSDVAKIDLEKFLKRVRALGREQFLKRETINRITVELAMIHHRPNHLESTSTLTPTPTPGPRLQSS
ncbi:UEV domain-containing protein [Melampsora americana]|nr:UEV domain-containing protein [Melampsora americana]